MKQIRKRLTYANVMSSIAVFLILGGATAFAASHLGKNSVGSKQLKKNAVITNKIKKEAVTGGKIKKGSITGTQINVGTLPTVPSATNATNATNANATNGMHLAKINFTTGPSAPATTVFSADGLTLIAECTTSNLELIGTTSINDSEIYESGNYLSEYAGGFSQNFDVGDIEEIGNEIGDGSQDEVQGQLVYSTPAGAVVTAQFSLNDSTIYGEGSGCAVEGTVEFS